ncbi:MAG: DUF1992 domain-containing protein [Ilumatobacteraceae bacterium]
MTERKPTGASWESWTERQIDEGRRAGLFDGLDGEGKPIEGLDGPHDEEWWVKAKLRREKVEYLPPTIAIRRERDVAVAAALDAADEEDVHRIIGEINGRIRYVNSHTVIGPPSTVWVVDVDSILERWRATRPSSAPAGEPREPADDDSGVAHRRSTRWWRRRVS